MRTPESKIKDAILHPKEEVRLTALDYFTRLPVVDEAIMPLVIEAVERYGRDSAFRILRWADSLPQTEATIDWLTGELSRDWNLDDMGNDNYCFAVALILNQARPDLLRADMVDLPCFPEELRDGFLERLEMASWDWDRGWAALEAFAEETRSRDKYLFSDMRREKRIIECLARHHDKGGEVLPLLHRRYRHRDRDLMEWLESSFTALAGKLRLEEAVPVLVERLHESDEFYADSCVMALKNIGSDAVVAAIADQWGEGDSEFRCLAAEVLGDIPSDLGAQKCMDFFRVERDEEVKLFLARALLQQFESEAVEPIRQMVLGAGEDVDADERDLRGDLVAVCAISGATFPEFDQWYEELVQSNWGWGRYPQDRIRENFWDDGDEDFDDEWEDDYEEDYEEDFEEDYEDDFDGEDFGVPSLLPIRREGPDVGRNDPCPCGSGKKYKKCCLKKDQADSEPYASKFPIGTIALYGPDDQRTTKIAAAVIKLEGAEPILRRWVGTNVKNSSKVRREIREFFTSYGVKSVVATEKNMGCPHEEGEDFPEGEDCPFCPWWKGKQGSAAE